MSRASSARRTVRSTRLKEWCRLGPVVDVSRTRPAGARVDPKKMQLSLTGFLEANTPPFMRDLWALLVSAQENEHGIPIKVVDILAHL